MKPIHIKSDSSSIKQAAIINAVSKYATVIINLILTAILARILTPEDYGIVAVTTVFTNFFVTQISQMTQIFSLQLFFAAFPFFPQISQMGTDFRPVRSG